MLQVCALLYHTSSNVDKNSGFVKTAENPPPKKFLLIRIHLKIDVPAVLVGMSRNTFSC